jgi:hypothetical protein
VIGDAADDAIIRTSSLGNLGLCLFLVIYVSAYWWAKHISPVTAIILGISLGAVMLMLRTRSPVPWPTDRMTGWLNLGTMVFLAAQTYDHFFFPRGVDSWLGDNMMIFGCSAGAILLAGQSLLHFRLIK